MEERHLFLSLPFINHPLCSFYILRGFFWRSVHKLLPNGTFSGDISLDTLVYQV